MTTAEAVRDMVECPLCRAEKNQRCVDACFGIRRLKRNHPERVRLALRRALGLPDNEVKP